VAYLQAQGMRDETRSARQFLRRPSLNLFMLDAG